MPAATARAAIPTIVTDPGMLALVYEELRALARKFRARHPDSTLAPTEIVHEAWVRMARNANTPWSDRAHFCAVAATAMRQVLTDRARRRRAAKRGGAQVAVTLEEAATQAAPIVDLVALDDVLSRLEELDARHARIVELRIFGGLTVEEIAACLALSTRTIEKEWRSVKAWLTRELKAAERA